MCSLVMAQLNSEAQLSEVSVQAGSILVRAITVFHSCLRPECPVVDDDAFATFTMTHVITVLFPVRGITTQTHPA